MDTFDLVFLDIAGYILFWTGLILTTLFFYLEFASASAFGRAGFDQIILASVAIMFLGVYCIKKNPK